MEHNILFESDNFYVWQLKDCVEIRCNVKSGHSVVVGKKPSLEDAKTTIARLEPHIDNYRKFAGIL